MSGHVLNFPPDGTFSGLHTDRTDLSALGTMQMRRASFVEFSETTQKWEVRWTREGPTVFTHPSRLECLLWEREQLQAKEAL